MFHMLAQFYCVLAVMWSVLRVFSRACSTKGGDDIGCTPALQDSVCRLSGVPSKEFQRDYRFGCSYVLTICSTELI